MKPSGKALIVIDVQNDYFPGGKLPLWNADETLSHIVNAIADAGKRGIPVILVKHAADQAKGAGFFIPGTTGADIHPDILKAAPDAPVIIKHRADAFNGTNLNAVLDKSGIEKILICGMADAKLRWPHRHLEKRPALQNGDPAGLLYFRNENGTRDRPVGLRRHRSRR